MIEFAVIAGSVLPQLGQMQNGTLYAFLLIGGLQVVVAVLAQFGIQTRGKRLDHVSP